MMQGIRCALGLGYSTSELAIPPWSLELDSRIYFWSSIVSPMRRGLQVGILKRIPCTPYGLDDIMGEITVLGGHSDSGMGQQTCDWKK
jgi:hypothetical protein